MSGGKSGRSGVSLPEQIATIRQRLNYGQSAADRWDRFRLIFEPFYKSFKNQNGRSCHDLVSWSDKSHQIGLEEMADSFLETNGHGNRFWPDDESSPNINKLKYSNPNHKKRIRHYIKVWFYRKNRNLQRNTKARNNKASNEKINETVPGEHIESNAGNILPGPSSAGTSARAPEAPMFPLEESMSMALDDPWSDISEVPDGLEAEESMEVSMKHGTGNQYQAYKSSQRINHIESFNDPLDMGSAVDDGDNIAEPSAANSDKRAKGRSGLDHNDRAYRPPSRRTAATAGYVAGRGLRSRSRTPQPTMRSVTQRPSHSNQEEDIIDLTTIDDLPETTTPTLMIKEDVSEHEPRFSRNMDPSTTSTGAASKEKQKTLENQVDHNTLGLSGLSQSPEPTHIQPRIEITYKFVSSRKPIYDVQIWSPRESFRKLSLRQLKAELQIGDVETIIMRLSGPNLRFKCRVRNDDESLFQRAKREMNDLISNGLERIGACNLFEVVIEIEAERDSAPEPSPQLGSSRETSWLL